MFSHIDSTNSPTRHDVCLQMLRLRTTASNTSSNGSPGSKIESCFSIRAEPAGSRWCAISFSRASETRSIYDAREQSQVAPHDGHSDIRVKLDLAKQVARGFVLAFWCVLDQARSGNAESYSEAASSKRQNLQGPTKIQKTVQEPFWSPS